MAIKFLSVTSPSDCAHLHFTFDIDGREHVVAITQSEVSELPVDSAEELCLHWLAYQLRDRKDFSKLLSASVTESIPDSLLTKLRNFIGF